MGRVVGRLWRRVGVGVEVVGCSLTRLSLDKTILVCGGPIQSPDGKQSMSLCSVVDSLCMEAFLILCNHGVAVLGVSNLILISYGSTTLGLGMVVDVGYASYDTRCCSRFEFCLFVSVPMCRASRFFCTTLL